MTTNNNQRSHLAPLRASLRPALRELRFHKLRSLAAILLIAIPVALTTFALADGSAHDGARSLESENVVATYYGGTCEQDTKSGLFDCIDATGDVIARNLTSGEHQEGYRNGGANLLELVRPVLPAGASASAISFDPFMITANLGDGIARTYSMIPENVSGPLGKPTPPPGGIAIDESTAKVLDVTVGDSVTVWAAGHPDEKKSLTISEVTPLSYTITSEPLSQSHAAPTVEQRGVVRIFTSTDLTWSEIKEFNRNGFVVSGEQVRSLDVPESEQYQQFSNAQSLPFEQNNSSRLIEAITLFALLLTAAIIVLLVISPVFSISASSNTSTFALMRSQGASKRDIFRAVIFYGLVTGIIGTAVGWTTGMSTAFGMWKFAYPKWAFEPEGIWLILIPVVAVIGSVIVSMLPATLASRTDIIAGITGAPTGKLLRWRNWMWAGPVLLALTIVTYTVVKYIPLTGESWATFIGSTNALTPVLGLLGLTLSAPALAYGAGSLSKPLAVRLAGRELRRNGMRTVPVIAAIAGLVFLSSTISSSNTNYYRHQNEQLDEVFSQSFGVISEKPSWDKEATDAEDLVAGVVKDLDETNAENVKRLYASSIERAREILGPGKDVIVYSVSSPYSASNEEVTVYSDYSRACSNGGVFGPQPSLFVDTKYADRCAYENMLDGLPTPSSLGDNLIADESILEIFRLSEADERLARDTLSSGGVLAAKHHGSSDSTRVEFKETTYTERYSDNEVRRTEANLAVAAVLPDVFPGIVLSFDAAKKLEITPKSSNVLLLSDASDRTIASAGKNFEEVNAPQYYLPLKRVPDLSSMLAVPLGAAGIVVAVLGLVIALSLPHIRQTFEKYSAVGASQKTLRKIGSLYTGLMAVVAVAPGYLLSTMASSFDYQERRIAANGIQVSTSQSYSLAENWIVGLIFLIGIPLIALAIGWFTAPKAGMEHVQD